MEKFLQSGMNLLFSAATNGMSDQETMTGSERFVDFKTSRLCIGMILAFRSRSGTYGLRFLCPFGLIQELLYKIPFPKKKLWKGLPGSNIFCSLYFVLILPVGERPNAKPEAVQPAF